MALDHQVAQTEPREVATRTSRIPRVGAGRGTHLLYILVLIAVGLGIAVGFIAPEVAKDLKVLGQMFISLVKMMIAPIIFCTIVTGIGSVGKASTVGKVGVLALMYFLAMTTLALIIGLVVGNIIRPGQGVGLPAGKPPAAPAGKAQSLTDFVLGSVPDTLFSALTSTSVLQTLLVAVLVGFAIQSLGDAGEPLIRGVKLVQGAIFKILSIVMWIAPVGAFGAIAAVVAESKGAVLGGLALIMTAFYITCIVFVFGVLGVLLKLSAGTNIFKLVRYLSREYLLIVATASSEIALPRLMAKMEHLGVSKAVVGITVPTGYSFNLDGTAIYLTMSSLFVAEALNKPFSIDQQVGLLVFMIVASKGAGAVAGAGLAALTAGLQAHRPDLVDGIGLIVGIDRFMAEARSLTNFSGNAVACLVIGSWVNQLDRTRVQAVLDGRVPFDESTVSESH